MNEVNEKENIVSKYGVNKSKGVERKNWDSFTGILFKLVGSKKNITGKNRYCIARNADFFLKEMIVLGTKPTKNGAKKINSKEEEVCVISKVGKARAKIR